MHQRKVVVPIIIHISAVVEMSFVVLGGCHHHHPAVILHRIRCVLECAPFLAAGKCHELAVSQSALQCHRCMPECNSGLVDDSHHTSRSFLSTVEANISRRLFRNTAASISLLHADRSTFN